MRLKKWRGNNEILVFVNGFQPNDAEGYPGPEVNVAISGSTPEGWVTSVKGTPSLTEPQLKQLRGEVLELTGVTAIDGFQALLKEVDW